MRWKIIVRPEAARELEEAARWYGRQRKELKAEFLAAIQECLDKAAANPRISAPRERLRQIRWVRPDRFPYRVIYAIRENDRSIIVVSILHSARSDNHWRGHAKETD